MKYHQRSFLLIWASCLWHGLCWWETFQYLNTLELMLYPEYLRIKGHMKLYRARWASNSSKHLSSNKTYKTHVSHQFEIHTQIHRNVWFQPAVIWLLFRDRVEVLENHYIYIPTHINLCSSNMAYHTSQWFLQTFQLYSLPHIGILQSLVEQALICAMYLWIWSHQCFPHWYYIWHLEPASHL